MMKDHKLTGTVIDALIRDCESIRHSGYPFGCRGLISYSEMYRIETVEINGPITIGKVQVKARNLVATNINRMIAMPHNIVSEVYKELHDKKIC